jgi:ubiquinone/menaquinone biosynthesis C-methylase UbiE
MKNTMFRENKTDTEKRNFDQEAVNWDQIPGRVKMTRDIAKSLIREVHLTSSMDVLDFGCGTGLLTLAIQPFIRSITGVDSSQGMLDVFKTKIKEQNLINVKAKHIDLDKGDVLDGTYNLIVSSMALHHIKNINHLLKQFYSLLLPSGQMAIADLDLDDGQFHSNNDGVFHFGFDLEYLQQIFLDAGFRNVRHQTAAQIEKPLGNGQFRLFTMFLMTGCK